MLQVVGSKYRRPLIKDFGNLTKIIASQYNETMISLLFYREQQLLGEWTF